MKEWNPLTSLVRICLVSMLVAGVMVLAGTGISAAPEDDVEAGFNAIVEAWNDEDIEAFVAHFTEDGLAYQFYGLTGAEAAEAVAGDRAEAGPMVAASIGNVQVSGDGATADIEIEFEVGFLLYESWEFSLVNGAWLAGPGTTLVRPLPAGVKAVPMTLQEYAFGYDPAALSSGNFGFEVTNAGDEEHEVVVLGLGSEDSLSDVVTAVVETDELPDSVELVHFGGIFLPGIPGTVILPEPLDAGRYALVCFLGAPDGTPHAVLGMTSEFTVGGVSAPTAGDAGLADTSNGSSGAGLLLGGLSLVVTLTLLAIYIRRTGTEMSRDQREVSGAKDVR